MGVERLSSSQRSAVSTSAPGRSGAGGCGCDRDAQSARKRLRGAIARRQAELRPGLQHAQRFLVQIFGQIDLPGRRPPGAPDGSSRRSGGAKRKERGRGRGPQRLKLAGDEALSERRGQPFEDDGDHGSSRAARRTTSSSRPSSPPQRGGGPGWLSSPLIAAAMACGSRAPPCSAGSSSSRVRPSSAAWRAQSTGSRRGFSRAR